MNNTSQSYSGVANCVKRVHKFWPGFPSPRIVKEFPGGDAAEGDPCTTLPLQQYGSLVPCSSPTFKATELQCRNNFSFPHRWFFLGHSLVCNIFFRFSSNFIWHPILIKNVITTFPHHCLQVISNRWRQNHNLHFMNFAPVIGLWRYVDIWIET